MSEEYAPHRMRESCDCQACNESKSLASELSASLFENGLLSAENAKLKAVLHTIAYTIDQHDLRSALRSGDQLKIIASVTTLFNDCRDKAQAALEAKHE